MIIEILNSSISNSKLGKYGFLLHFHKRCEAYISALRPGSTNKDIQNVCNKSLEYLIDNNIDVIGGHIKEYDNKETKCSVNFRFKDLSENKKFISMIKSNREQVNHNEYALNNEVRIIILKSTLSFNLTTTSSSSYFKNLIDFAEPEFRRLCGSEYSIGIEFHIMRRNHELTYGNSKCAIVMDNHGSTISYNFKSVHIPKVSTFKDLVLLANNKLSNK